MYAWIRRRARRRFRHPRVPQLARLRANAYDLDGARRMMRDRVRYAPHEKPREAVMFQFSADPTITRPAHRN